MVLHRPVEFTRHIGQVAVCCLMATPSDMPFNEHYDLNGSPMPH
jgi:hypothetical protein